MKSLEDRIQWERAHEAEREEWRQNHSDLRIKRLLYRPPKRDDGLLYTTYRTELHRFRFEEAPTKYCNGEKRSIIPFDGKDFANLMTWKMSHRKMNVSSSMQNNPEAFIAEKTKAAIEIYEDNSLESDAESATLSARHIAAMNKLAELQGLCYERGTKHWHPIENQPNTTIRENGTLSTPCTGPTFTSLLLSIHDKDNVLHFGYEVYSWLCFNGHLPQPKSFPYKE